MSMTYLPTVLSTLFRLLSYVFLRIIPGPPILVALPTVFVAYLASLLFVPATVEKKHVEKTVVKDEQEANGHTEATVAPSTGPTALQTLVFSLPNSNKTLRILNLVINATLLLATFEFVAYPFFDTAEDVIFSRIGAVDSESAKIVVRYPLVAGENNTIADGVQLMYREVLTTTPKEWSFGPVFPLEAENDWVSTVTLHGLYPSTLYEYRLAASTEKTLLPYPARPISFRTFPDPRLNVGGTQLRFIASSCTMPNFPYRPFQSNSIKGFDLLADYLAVDSETQVEKNSTVPASIPASFLMFLGDFIYADVPIRRKLEKKDYRRLYRRNYKSTGFRRLYETLPFLSIYDDHEIKNNYYAGMTDEKETVLSDDATNTTVSEAALETETLFDKANDAYTVYSSQANPTPKAAGENYYHFRHADVGFFVLDTRRYRDDGRIKGSDEDAEKTMLGKRQADALLSWLEKVKTTTSFRFIVSSVPFTSLWGHDAQYDSWAGYAEEKQRLLDAFHSVGNVIVISGDRHEFAVVEFNTEGGLNPVHEISTSPLSAFYVPFFRTLSSASEASVGLAPMSTIETTVGDDGEKVEKIVTTTEMVPKERVIKYIAQGNHKFSDIEVDTRNLTRPVVRLTAVINGVKTYTQEIVGNPVTLQVPTALSSFMPGGFQDLLSLLGVQTRKWF